jgi:hypothetical protein
MPTMTPFSPASHMNRRIWVWADVWIVGVKILDISLIEPEMGNKI